jgi:hypothetical protein
MDRRQQLVMAGALLAAWIWLLLCSPAAHAIGTVPKTIQSGFRCSSGYPGAAATGGSIAGACSAHAATIVQPSGVAGCPSGSTTAVSYSFAYDASNGTHRIKKTTTQAKCPGWSGDSVSHEWQAATVSSVQDKVCPTSATSFDADNCTCVLNTRASAGQCNPYTCTARSLGDQSYGPYSTGGLDARYMCQTDSTHADYGCTTKLTPSGAYQGAAGWWISGTETVTGQACQGTGTGDGRGEDDAANPPGSSASSPQQPNTCPTGQVPGTINGQTHCYTPSNTAGSQKTETRKDGTGATVQTKTTEANCNGGQCTTTETVKDGAGSVISTTTTNVSQGEFCGQNKGHPACGSTGTGSGSGEEQGECEGAAANTAGCKPLGTPTDGQNVGSQTVNVGAITPVSGFGPSTSACPAPRSVSLAGGFTIQMPFDLLCEFANGIRPVVIGLAWLSAIFGFLGLSKKD